MAPKKQPPAKQAAAPAPKPAKQPAKQPVAPTAKTPPASAAPDKSATGSRAPSPPPVAEPAAAAASAHNTPANETPTDASLKTLDAEISKARDEREADQQRQAHEDKLLAEEKKVREAAEAAAAEADAERMAREADAAREEQQRLEREREAAAATAAADARDRLEKERLAQDQARETAAAANAAAKNAPAENETEPAHKPTEHKAAPMPAAESGLADDRIAEQQPLAASPSTSPAAAAGAPPAPGAEPEDEPITAFDPATPLFLARPTHLSAVNLMAASSTSAAGASYLAQLAGLTTAATSPLTHLVCSVAARQQQVKRRLTGADVPSLLPPMKHGNPDDTRSPSPTRARRAAQVIVDPQTMQKTLEEKRQAREMRKERKRRERDRLKAELIEAEQRAAEANRARDEERQRREEALKERLAQLRDRKAQRELEFLVSEKRAQQVRASKSLADIIQEQYEAQQLREEEERQRQLQERREKMHAPVLTGQDAVQRHFRIVEERRARKEAELKERQLAIERAPKVEPYHGTSYEHAAEDFVRFKNSEEDRRHARLYKHAKMHEYGNLVKRLYGPAPLSKTPQPGSSMGSGGSASPLALPHRSASPPPFITAPNGQALGTASPVVAKESQPPAERNKVGNQYLREALATRVPPPPGLRLQPLGGGAGGGDPQNDEFARFKERKRKGDLYLREVRELPRRSHTSPNASRTEEEQHKELRRLKAQTATLENRLHGQRMDLDDPEACLETNEQYLEVVRLKLEMLRRSDQHR